MTDEQLMECDWALNNRKPLDFRVQRQLVNEVRRLREGCAGCGCAFRACAFLWASQRKCCPDCDHAKEKSK